MSYSQFEVKQSHLLGLPLGNWDISKAYGLEYINANTWFGDSF